MVDYGGYSGCDDPSFGSICAYNITTLPHLHVTTSNSSTTGISATISTGIGATRRQICACANALFPASGFCQLRSARVLGSLI